MFICMLCYIHMYEMYVYGHVCVRPEAKFYIFVCACVHGLEILVKDRSYIFSKEYLLKIILMTCAGYSWISWYAWSSWRKRRTRELLLDS